MRMTRPQILVIILLCLLMASPELGVGFELMAIVDTFGIELVLFYFSAQLWGYWYFVKSKLEKFDPYFFLSPMSDVAKCPGLLAHAVPGSMSLLMCVLAITAVSV